MPVPAETVHQTTLSGAAPGAKYHNGSSWSPAHYKTYELSKTPTYYELTTKLIPTGPSTNSHDAATDQKLIFSPEPFTAADIIDPFPSALP